MQTTRTAIVIGGGIGGLAAGIALRRAGLDVDLFERAEEVREVGAGISLWANAIRALDTLGLADVIRSFSVPDFPAGLRSWQGAVLTTAAIDELRQTLGELCLVMHRADLHAALLAALDPARVHLGMRCLGFEAAPDGVVARFSNGASARGDLLIGADGLHSIVRAQLHGEQPPRYAGYTAWRAVVAFEPDRLVPGESWGHGARFGQVPMSGGRAYWFATRNVPEHRQSPDGEQAELRRIFRGWHSPIEDLIAATDESAILRNDIYDRPGLRRWGEGRVTLLGDAAHPMTPNLGQGACQALEDAVALGACLARNADVVPALRSYEAQRIPRCNGIVRQSRQVGAIGQWQNPLAVRFRNAFFKRLSPRLQARQLARVLNP